MPDIFISYSSRDRDFVHKLAYALEKYSLNIWWDPEIKPGQVYRQVIQEALDSANCVIVVWSNESVKSMWVQAEASQAIERNVLIPVSHDNARIPMPFNGLQTANLEGWNGDIEDKKFKVLISGVSLHCSNIKKPNDSKKPEKEPHTKEEAKLLAQKRAKEKTKEEAKLLAQKRAEEKTKEEAKLLAQKRAKEKNNKINDPVKIPKENDQPAILKNKFYLLSLIPGPLYFATLYFAYNIVTWSLIITLLLLFSMMLLATLVYINKNIFHTFFKYCICFFVTFEIAFFIEMAIDSINIIPDFINIIFFPGGELTYIYPFILSCISLFIFLKLKKINEPK